MNSAQKLKAIVEQFGRQMSAQSSAVKNVQWNTPLYVFQHLNATDRLEVASMCWQAGNFDLWGEIHCTCNRIKNTGMWYCQEEWLAEAIGAVIIIPLGWPIYIEGISTEHFASYYDVEPWVVRFRRLLTDPPMKLKFNEKET